MNNMKQLYYILALILYISLICGIILSEINTEQSAYIIDLELVVLTFIIVVIPSYIGYKIGANNE